MVLSNVRVRKQQKGVCHDSHAADLRISSKVFSSFNDLPLASHKVN